MTHLYGWASDWAKFRLKKNVGSSGFRDYSFSYTMLFGVILKNEEAAVSGHFVITHYIWHFIDFHLML